MTTQVRAWLDNAILQSVAESYLDRSVEAGGPRTLDEVLGFGVNHPGKTGSELIISNND